MSTDEIINYIKSNIDCISTEDRQDILQIIINSGIDKKHIQTKPSGTQVKLDYVSHGTLIAIYACIENKLKSKHEENSKFE